VPWAGCQSSKRNHSVRGGGGGSGSGSSSSGGSSSDEDDDGNNDQPFSGRKAPRRAGQGAARFVERSRMRVRQEQRDWQMTDGSWHSDLATGSQSVSGFGLTDDGPAAAAAAAAASGEDGENEVQRPSPAGGQADGGAAAEPASSSGAAFPTVRALDARCLSTLYEQLLWGALAVD
jgi:hypothetical protein